MTNSQFHEQIHYLLNSPRQPFSPNLTSKVPFGKLAYTLMTDTKQPFAFPTPNTNGKFYPLALKRRHLFFKRLLPEFSTLSSTPPSSISMIFSFSLLMNPLIPSFLHNSILSLISMALCYLPTRVHLASPELNSLA